MTTRRYSELVAYSSFEDRLDYLMLGGTVGRATFDSDRWINQDFYRSRAWKDARERVLIRDNGCNLGVPGYEIFDAPLVHHMNPMDVEDIIHGEEWIVDPEFLITTTQATHNEIHFGFRSPGPPVHVDRQPGDTRLW